MSRHAIKTRIVADGRRRAAAGMAAAVERRIEVIERRYQRLMDRTSWGGRWVIYQRMRRRIRRVRKKYPTQAGLYVVDTRRFGRPQRRREG